MYEDVDELLDFAKYDLMNHPNSSFISSVVFHLKFSWDTSVPTAATNGINLHFNPEFFKALSPQQRVFVLAHEGWHVALQHLNRIKNLGDVTGQDFKLWNIAGDYVINLMCHNAGMDVVQKPIYNDAGDVIFTKSLLDPRFADMSTEEVYNFLKDEQKKQEQSGSGSQNSFNIPVSPDMDDLQLPPNEMTQEQFDDVIEEIIIKSATVAEMKGDIGSIPGDIAAEIQDIISPPVPWYVLFLRFMHDFTDDDYSYSRPNKRYLPDIVIPTLHSETVEKIVFALDISVSVSDEEFSLYLAKVEEARRVLQPQETHIITFDTKVQNVFVFKQTDRINSVTFVGRGGTRPQCVLNYLAEQKKRPTFLVFFSDMDFRPLEKDPGYPVLWVGVQTYGEPYVNFGQYIKYS